MAKKAMVSRSTAKTVPTMKPTLRRRAWISRGLLLRAAAALSPALCCTFLFIFSALCFSSLLKRFFSCLPSLITGHLPFFRMSVFPAGIGSIPLKIHFNSYFTIPVNPKTGTFFFALFLK